MTKKVNQIVKHQQFHAVRIIFFPSPSGLCPRTAAFLRLPGARYRVLPEAEAGDAERDAAAGGPRARDDGGRGQQGATAARPGQQGQRLPGDEDSR